MKYIISLIFLVVNTFAFDAFISVDELKQNLKNENLIILDVNSKADYKQSHIDGALHVDISDFIENKTRVKRKPFHKILQKEFIDLGINNNSEIVIYSRSTKKDQLNSSYLAFVLIQSGFNSVSILDGGYMAWVFKNNRLVSSEYPKDIIDGIYELTLDNSLLVDSNYIKENQNNAQIIDSRNTNKYFGTKKDINIKKFGHIPSAKSSYYKDKFLDDFILRSDNELDDIFILGLELERDRDLIVYGDDKFTASMNWFILYKKLGFLNAKIYDGSFKEWSELDNSTVLFKWE